MRNKKKIISILLVVVMILSFTAFTATAEEAYVEDIQPMANFCCWFPNHVRHVIYSEIGGRPVRWVGLLCLTCGWIGQ